MTVYVDEIRKSAPYVKNHNTQWPYPYFCHMVADSLEELFDMADKLGLKEKWFQHHEKPYLAHFDLVKYKREEAIKLGAKEITSREWIKRHL